MNPLSLKPFLCRFVGLLWVIVLLHNPFSSQLQLSDRWHEILVKNLLIGQVVQVQKQESCPRPPPCFTIGWGPFLDMQCWLFSKQPNGNVLFWEQRLPSINPPMNVMAIQFSSYCRCMHICPRCYQRGLQLSRSAVCVGLYLIYCFSGATELIVLMGIQF